MAVGVSVGVITCNEEATIGPLLEAFSAATGSDFTIAEIIVVSAECRDQTDTIIQQLAARDPRIRLITEPKRRGKSAAINTFLAARSKSDFTLLSSGDVLPAPDFLPRILATMADPSVGMAGGRPVPLNSRRTLTGRMAHALWELHHEVALRSPKLGETIVFRSTLVTAVPEESPVDEASIEQTIRAGGWEIRYVSEALIENRGPDTLAEWFSQRKRIAYGHAWLKNSSGYAVSTDSSSTVVSLLLGYILRHPGEILTASILVGFEIAAKISARMDFDRGNKYRIWDIAASTKSRNS